MKIISLIKTAIWVGSILFPVMETIGKTPTNNDRQNGNIIKNGCFEGWEWQPIKFNLKKELKKRKKDRENFNLEIRGPMCRQLKGINGISGTMIDGENAFEGKSLFLENISKTKRVDVIGFHSLYSYLIAPDTGYTWEVWLKGEGKFLFRAWLGGADKMTKTFKWIAFPNLINIRPTRQWKKYTGQFNMPSAKYEGCVLQDKISCAIVVEPKTVLYIDNFSIRKTTKYLPVKSGKKADKNTKIWDKR